MNNIFSKIMVKTISFYQKLISPLLGNNCRFYPSCSQYLKESIEYKGLFIGILSGTKRILRCNPMNPGGYDPASPGQNVNSIKKGI
jgi:putative membrane protein insertion efficiency factor